MALEWPDKDPDEVLDYPIDWTAWLVSGAKLSTTAGHCTVTVVDGTGLTVDSLIVNLNGIVTVWLSGGTLGTTYLLKATVRDDQTPHRIGVRRIKMKVKAK
jgi:hypothetical protein